MKRVDEFSMRTDSNDNLVGDKTMKRNRYVYVVFGTSSMCDIDAVCASKEAVQMYMATMKDRILDFLHSDRVSVTIEEDDLGLDGISYSVKSNVPGYAPLVFETEVENSQSRKISEIQHVWVAWSITYRRCHTAHLSKQAMEEYLKLKDWMDDNGNFEADIVGEYRKFEVISASRFKRKL